MSKHYFTFGFGQKHANGYHVIEAEDELKAREEMHNRFGAKWASRYDSAEEAGVEKFKLHEVFLMFEVTMFEGGQRAKELEAEFEAL